jgi:molybdate transport system substrate-binding protein
MRSAGLYDAVKARLVFGENVAQALQFVESGNAQIGIIALPLALSPTVRGQGRYSRAPVDSYPRMDQGGAIMKWAKDVEGAEAFRSFLLSSEGQAVLWRFGFAQPGA